MLLEQVQGLACLSTAAERAPLQPSGACVSEEVVVVACEWVVHETRDAMFANEDWWDESSSATPAVESSHAEAWGSTGSGGAVWQGSGGPRGRCASRACRGRSSEMTARVTARLMKQTATSLGCCRQGRARRTPGPGRNQTFVEDCPILCHYMTLMENFHKYISGFPQASLFSLFWGFCAPGGSVGAIVQCLKPWGFRCSNTNLSPPAQVQTSCVLCVYCRPGLCNFSNPKHRHDPARSQHMHIHACTYLASPARNRAAPDQRVCPLTPAGSVPFRRQELLWSALGEHLSVLQHGIPDPLCRTALYVHANVCCHVAFRVRALS